VNVTRCLNLPKFRYCQFCGIDNNQFEEKFCSIICADLFDSILFYGLGKNRIPQLTVAQKIGIIDRLQLYTIDQLIDSLTLEKEQMEKV